MKQKQIQAKRKVQLGVKNMQEQKQSSLKNGDIYLQFYKTLTMFEVKCACLFGLVINM